MSRGQAKQREQEVGGKAEQVQNWIWETAGLNRSMAKETKQPETGPRAEQMEEEEIGFITGKRQGASWQGGCGGVQSL